MGRHGQAVAESTISRSNPVGKVFLTEKSDFNSVHVPNDGSAGWGRSSGGFSTYLQYSIERFVVKRFLPYIN